MKIGTKSVLFGAHCFLFHWFFVARGWWKLYGWRPVYIGQRTVTRHMSDGYGANWPYPYRKAVYVSLWNPKLWLAFFVHDIGYIGKPNMDGDEGELHPVRGAEIMLSVCGKPWNLFVLYHSRFLAKQHREKPSALCMADKLAIALTPRWLYLPCVRATGEIHEYMAKSSAMNGTANKYSGMNLDVSSQKAWHADMVAYVLRWVAEHRDGREDTWTPNTKADA